jgi:hypothetical protein
MIEGFPTRQHYLKFQVSIPINKTRQSVRAYNRVLQTASEHLKALAGGAAFNVEIRAVYQDRGPGKVGIVWRDILMVCGFDGPLNESTKTMAIDRKTFEFNKLVGGAAKSSPILDIGGSSGEPKKLILPS